MLQDLPPSPNDFGSESTRPPMNPLFSPEAIGRMMEELRPYLKRVAQDELGSDLRTKADASDLVQQTCLDAYRHAAQCRATTQNAFHSWVRGILLHNLAKLTKYYRKAKKRRISRECPIGLEPTCPSSDSPSKLAAKNEEEQCLYEALGRLPETYRRVVFLHCYYKKSFEDIAWVMDRSSEAVRKLWSRALERLKSDITR